MHFRTVVPISPVARPIDYTSNVVLLGSCFAVNMAEQLQYFQFQAVCNPFGILFHPLAIEKLVCRVILEQPFVSEDLFYYNERWHCFDLHSDLSSANKEEMLITLNTIRINFRKQLIMASKIVLTYGTSWVYRTNTTDLIVANCHKVPQKEFTKELLTIEVIQDSIANTCAMIQNVNAEVEFIFTVSPVRHIKDGFVQNQLSKAHLIAAIHKQLTVLGPHYTYFPSYEIMMDELRDYRFYGEDMLHPNATALAYIWEQFKESTIAASTYVTMKEVASIRKSLQHRAFDHTSERHKKFENNLRSKIELLISQYSFMKF